MSISLREAAPDPAFGAATAGSASPGSLGEIVRDYASLLADGWAFLFGRSPGPLRFDVILLVGEDAVTLARSQASGGIAASGIRLPLSEIALAGRIVADFARAEGVATPRVALAAEEGTELALTRTLPHAPSRLLDAIVATEARTGSPFPPDRLRVAWSSVASPATGQTVQIRLFDGEVVGGIVAALWEQGLRDLHVASIERGRVAWSTRPAWVAPDATRAKDGGDALAGWWRPQLGAILFAAAAILGNYAYSEAMLWHLGPEASEALAAAQQAGSAEADLSRILQARAASSQRLGVIDALSSALDDSSFVESLILSRGEIELQTVSPSAADVLRAVSTITALRDPALKSGVARDGQQIERFTIGAKVPEIVGAGDGP